WLTSEAVAPLHAEGDRGADRTAQRPPDHRREFVHDRRAKAMLKLDEAYSGFSVDDIEKARAFYSQTLGFEVADEMGMLGISIGGGKHVFVYPKDDHEPATFTVLKIPTDDIDGAVAALKAKGVRFEQYDGITGDDDIARGRE